MSELQMYCFHYFVSSASPRQKIPLAEKAFNVSSFNGLQDPFSMAGVCFCAVRNKGVVLVGVT